MDEIASLKLLDAILAALNAVTASSDNVNPHVRFFDLARILESNGFNVRITDFELALEKLEEDKFIKKVVGYESKGDNILEDEKYPAYAINFNGQYFIRTVNGYVIRERTVQNKILADERHDRQDRLNQKLLVVGAFGAAAGAILLVVWEAGVHFCWW